MFETITPAPPDPILGLSESFREDTNPKKVNLSVGVYKNEQGVTPIFTAVKKAEQILADSETSKSYLPMTGHPPYTRIVQELLLGAEAEVLGSGQLVTAQTPGGTGALRVAADFLHTAFPDRAIWISNPSWANHKNIFSEAGLTVKSYPYYHAESNSLDAKGMLEALKTIPSNDILLLHGSCHNPTGIDLNAEQWGEVAEVCKERGLLPFIDFAYQGFAEGIEQDAGGIRTIAQAVPEMIVASSFSKNIGLYNDRTGALTFLSGSADAAKALASQLKLRIRRNYSNPPAHGALIVATVMNDPALREEWETELTAVRERIKQLRQQLVDGLTQAGCSRDFSFITGQNGMFSFTGLTKEQVAALREQYAIYIVNSGRINVAGLTPDNLEYVCQAIASVVG